MHYFATNRKIVEIIAYSFITTREIRKAKNFVCSTGQPGHTLKQRDNPR